MEILGKEEKSEKTIQEYYCEKCDFKCCKKFNWNRHLNTSKHTEELFGKEQKEQKEQNDKVYMCICGKIYNNASGLWKHKNKCCHDKSLPLQNTDDNNEPTDKQLIVMLLKQNTDLIKEQSDIKELILEIVKNGTMNNSHNTTHTNSHNKAFNLNFFLNETCKNAMNITDFVDSIKLQLSDLEKFGEIGYVEGLSKIIVKNLNDLDETIRPIHCTDKKRETMYIKDKNQWEKEDDNKSKLRKIIKRVQDKNIRLLPQFREKYPDYGDARSKTSDIYNKMVVEAMGGTGNNDIEKLDKIIHNISKVTTVK